MATERKRTIKPEVEVVDAPDESTVDTDEVSGPRPDQAQRTAYRVLVNHDEHTVGDVAELEPNGRTASLVAQGYLEPLD